MKGIFSLVVLVCVSFAVTAQSNVNPRNNYRRKQYLDSLQKAFGQPTVQINPQPLLVHNTPVLGLNNDGEKVGMSGEDTVYQMKKDNMLILKPNTKTTYMPNAAEGKIFMVPPVKKKP